MKKLRITVDGKVFEVVVESLDEQGNPVVGQPSVPAFQQTSIAPPPTSAPKPAAAAAPAGPGTVTSPLAGRIVSIDCQLGQKVASGAQLATVEAMKMNTFVFAPKAGKVAEIKVSVGDAVQEGQVLARIE